MKTAIIFVILIACIGVFASAYDFLCEEFRDFDWKHEVEDTKLVWAVAVGGTIILTVLMGDYALEEDVTGGVVDLLKSWGKWAAIYYVGGLIGAPAVCLLIMLFKKQRLSLLFHAIYDTCLFSAIFIGDMALMYLLRKAGWEMLAIFGYIPLMAFALVGIMGPVMPIFMAVYALIYYVPWVLQGCPEPKYDGSAYGSSGSGYGGGDYDDYDDDYGGGSFSFPGIIYDYDENPWRLMNSGYDIATYYCQATGETDTFYASDFQYGAPSGYHRR